MDLAVAEGVLAVGDDRVVDRVLFHFLVHVERALHVDRVDLVEGHAVGHQRGFQHGVRLAAEGSLAGEFLEVPDILPACRNLAAPFLGVVGQDHGIDVVADAPFDRMLRPHLASVDDRIVDFLQHAFRADLQGGVEVAVHDVPRDLAALDHEADAARGGAGAVDRDLAVRKLLQIGIDEGSLHPAHGIATPVDEHEFLLVGHCRGEACHCRRDAERGAHAEEHAAGVNPAFGIMDEPFDIILTIAHVGHHFAS